MEYPQQELPVLRLVFGCFLRAFPLLRPSLVITFETAGFPPLPFATSLQWGLAKHANDVGQR
jgi:hypothetical protein